MKDQLRIYSAVNGDLLYHSEQGTNVNERNEAISRAYDSGVLLYYDPGQGVVHSYLNATRNAPEQFMVVYEIDNWEGKLLERFKDQVEYHLNDVGWPLLTDVGGKQEFYNDLCTVSPVAPTPSVPELIDAMDTQQESGLRFGVNDRRDAARLVEYIADLDGKADVLVTDSYIPDEYEDTTVKVKTNRSVSGIQPIEETKDTYERAKLSKSVDTAKASIRSVADAVANIDGVPSSADPQHAAAALRKAGIDSLGIVPEVKQTDDTTGFVYATTTFVVGLAAGTVALWYLLGDALAAQMTGTYLLQLSPVVTVSEFLPKWAALVIGLFGIMLATVDRILIGTYKTGQYVFGSESEITPQQTVVNEARGAVEDLRAVKNQPLVIDDDEFLVRAKEAFSPLDRVSLANSRAVAQSAMLQKVAEGIGGLVLAAMFIGAVWYLQDLVVEHWSLLVWGLFVVGVAALVVRLGLEVSRRVLSGFTQRNVPSNGSSRSKQSSASDRSSASIQSSPSSLPSASTESFQSHNSSESQRLSTPKDQNRPASTKSRQSKAPAPVKSSTAAQNSSGNSGSMTSSDSQQGHQKRHDRWGIYLVFLLLAMIVLLVGVVYLFHL